MSRIPRDAWLEGLVNAVIHRSYSFMGDHIRVELFPDRIEITSPGRFPGIVDPARPLEIRRYARNPRIARVCADLSEHSGGLPTGQLAELVGTTRVTASRTLGRLSELGLVARQGASKQDPRAVWTLA